MKVMKMTRRRGSNQGLLWRWSKPWCVSNACFWHDQSLPRWGKSPKGGKFGWVLITFQFFLSYPDTVSIKRTPMLEYSLSHWLTFFSAAFILTLSLGPDLAFILAQTIRGGRKSGFAAMLGIWGGTITHIILAIIGLSAVITASAWAFTMVK